MNSDQRERVETLAAHCAGAIDWTTCHCLGLTDEQVKWLVESGRWQSLHPRVYVTFSGPIPLDTRQHAALLYAGAGAVLSHESAGRCWRLCSEPAAIHITVAYTREVEDQPGIVIHRSRTLDETEVHPDFTPRRTTIERTVLDLLADQQSAIQALGLVSDAIRGRLTTVDRIRAALLAKRCTRWRRVVLEALPDVRAGAQSVLEIKDARIRRAHGLPQGKRQKRRTADGTEYLDVVIEEWKLHVEIDGRLGHDRAVEIWRDTRRDNRSVRTGMRHLRYGWGDMNDRPCDVAIEQAVILWQQGWPGVFKRCRNCPATLPPELVQTCG